MLDFSWYKSGGERLGTSRCMSRHQQVNAYRHQPVQDYAPAGACKDVSKADRYIRFYAQKNGERLDTNRYFTKILAGNRPAGIVPRQQKV
jgi:hypothetical protein